MNETAPFVGHGAEFTRLAVRPSTGGRFDLTARKLAAPPENLLAALKSLPRTDDFVTVASSLSGRP